MSLRALAPALSLLLALGSHANAQQLVDLSPEVADAASARLAPGATFVHWISHIEVANPHVFRVVSLTRIAGEQPGTVRLQLGAERLLVSSKSDRAGPPHLFESSDKKPFTRPVDLATIYVPSSELPDAFVNLGKLLRQPCKVKALAVEVPGHLLATGTPAPAAPAQTGINQALGSDGPVNVGPGKTDAVVVAGYVKVHEDGISLVVVDAHKKEVLLRSWADPVNHGRVQRQIGKSVGVRGFPNKDGSGLDQVELLE